MSEPITREDLQYYVDWTSLKYYDDRIKAYIDQRSSLTVGGSKHPYWLEEPPVKDNLNKLFSITEEFTTGSTFVESDVVCGAGSVVYLDNTKDGLRYKLLVKVPREEQTSEDWSDLLLRLEKLSELVNNQGTTINKVANDLDDVEDRITGIVSQMQATEHSIHDILHSHEKIFATKKELETAIQELEAKIGNSGSSEKYATEEFVRDEIGKLPIGSIQTAVTNLEEQHQHVNETVNTLVTDVTNIQESCETLQTSITDVNNEITALQQDVHNNYITVENGVTKEQLTTEVRTVVDSEVETIVGDKIADAIANGATVSSIAYGEF